MIALVALAASILIVATTPQEEPQPTGVDLSAHYDGRLRARPNQVEVDAVDHPLYDVAMPEPVDCDVPELDMASDESWEEFAAVSGDCLNTLWAPVFEDLGLSVELPEFAVTRVSPDSPDADPEEGYTLAYYESDLSRITIVLPNVRHLGALLPPGQREEVWLALMGHEYGHHVQYATGILGIAHGMTWKAEDEQAELEALRRTELQAECMAGVGLRGITGADEEALRTANEHFNGGGDLDTHGSASNRAFWLEQGWSQATVEGCNTYGAATDQVA
ncbi:neutral zinc metallopeptidase [Nocardiopsis deserti]|uniref:neutral zinc metallopeptidase n=1 Tax=Nocardiopsis deserti TaxID=2605988 RepID=UPI00295895E1|nr:neutral zinc metallopeptidase [Nocardiopsis deserti]